MSFLPQSTSQFDPVLFRQQLHRFPELSGQEHSTANAIARQLQAFGLSPKTAVTASNGVGIVCEINSGKPGSTTLLRADFDALPIEETASHDHISCHCGVMHACGHDGHTASLMTVAHQLSLTPPSSGRVLLLFQPAEETGTGAADMLGNRWLAEQLVDQTFAYHNLPGYPRHSVITKPGNFACASTGVSIELIGKTSHAARPENGINPTQAMVALISFLQQLPKQFSPVFSLVTVVHAKLGESAFGTSPGYAKIEATLRSEETDTLAAMQRAITAELKHQCEQHQLESTLNWQESFRAVVNAVHQTEQVLAAAQDLGLKTVVLEEPMRWSEDMAEFLATWPGNMFCLGSGESHPELHNPDFDFPDPLIDTASRMFLRLIDTIHNGS